MSDSENLTMPQAEMRRVLLRAGYTDARVDEILRGLPDPVDLREAGPILQRYGVTRDHLEDLMGGSP